MTTKHITTRAMSYENPTPRRRQLSSGPLGGNKTAMFNSLKF
jgi:hypothetical protein